MNISELIEKLAAIRDKHGDLPVLDHEHDSFILKPYDPAVLYLEGEGYYMDECDPEDATVIGVLP